MERDPRDIMFSWIDPRGARVQLRRARWDGHVRERHEAIVPHLAAVRATLEAPHYIFSDIDNPDGLNYYRFGALSTPFERLYLKVVVTFGSKQTRVVGEIVTAFPVGRIRTGEVKRWPP